MQADTPLRVPRIVLGFAVVAAVTPAAFVYFRVQPVATMLIPVTLTAAPFLTRSASAFRVTALIAALLLTIFVVLGAMSVGYFFIPAMLGVLAAALLARPRSNID